jgi:hypothetical protein
MPEKIKGQKKHKKSAKMISDAVCEDKIAAQNNRVNSCVDLES